MGPDILVVDDDLNICELIKLYLDDEGYTVYLAHDGSQALDMFHHLEPSLVVLDLMLPVLSGQEVCRLIRKSSSVPVIMLTAKDSTRDKIEGLDSGADDYLVKPFEPLELCARIRALLRRSHRPMENKSEVVALGDTRVDLKRFEVTVNDQPIELKPREASLLHFLIINRNILFTREQLLDKVWGYEYAGETRTVDVHIRRLREKLGSTRSWNIKTVWGLGYKLEEK